MVDSQTYFIQLAGWLANAIGSSATLFANFTTGWAGLSLPSTVLQTSRIEAALAKAEATTVKVQAAGENLQTAVSAGDAEIISAFLELAATLTQFFAALSELAAAVRANINTSSIPDAVERAAAEEFADNLAQLLSDFILGASVTDQSPVIAFVLQLLGLLDWRRIPAEPGNSLSRDAVLRKLALSRIKDLFSDPAEHYRQTLAWGATGFDPSDWFSVYESFWDDETSLEMGVDAGEPFLRQGSFLISRDSTTNPPSLKLSFVAELEEALETRRDFDDHWSVNVSSSMKMTGGISGNIQPPFSLQLVPASGTISGELRGFFDRKLTERPFDIIAGTGLLTLSAENMAAGIGLATAGDPASGATINPLLFASLDELTLKIGNSEADGFVANLLADAELEGHFDLVLEWQANSGLRAQASGGMEIALPIHQQLGVVELETIYVALRILPDGTLQQELSAALAASLGPLVASVDRMGVQIDLRFAEGIDAEFGPFDLNLGFKPPNGVGLAIDAGVVKGGGYLYFDFDKQEYAGALELTFSEFISMKAIGLITTRMPDGSDGFSLLVIITAEFGVPFQLGLGFTLSAVGGLLGLNRTMLLQPLADGVRSGAINSVMFPSDVVANAPRIISDLQAFFLPAADIFLIGPMAMLGWGTPNLVTLSLGIIIEIPGNVAILGVLKVALPDEDAALLVLQVNFIGAIEFDKQQAWFFAALYESRILFITIEGEIGVLVNWSGDPNFVISVGGFHPAFSAPPLPFPEPRRIELSILNTDFARIRVEGYFAVTSNTVQFGANAELFFGLDAFSVEGQLIFDALFRTPPLYFIITISSSFSVKVFGVGLYGVRYRGTLEGTTPWRVEGTGSISLLFFDIDVDFSHTWGEEADATLPPIPVVPLLQAEFDKLENWKAQLPASHQLFVSLRSIDTASDLVLHPVGTLQISQRAIPLDLQLDKVGNQKPADANYFTVAVSSAGMSKFGDLEESFAIAQFKDMDDAAKLSSPAFEKCTSGLELSASTAQANTSLAVKRVVRYEKIIIDTQYKRFVKPLFVWFGSLFSLFLNGNSVSQSTLSQKYLLQKQPFEDKVAIQNVAWVVASSNDNSALAGSESIFSNQAKANEYLKQRIAADPELADSIHVIPNTEMRRAA